MSRRFTVSVALILLLSLAFRWPQLSRWELHIDESLYADVSRHVIERGDLLVNGAQSDKPPLLYWVQAPCLLLFGETETAARLPGLLAWLLGAVLILRLLTPRWDQDAVLTALVVWSLSPYGILHLSTGFTDPLMAVTGLGGLLCLAVGRPWEAGLWLGASLACKQTGLLYLGPAVLMLSDREAAKSFARGYAWVLLPLLLWSAFIANPKLGLWSRAAEYAQAPVHEAGASRGAVLWQQMSRGGTLFLVFLFGWAWRSGRIVRIALLSVGAYAAFLRLTHGTLYDRYWLWTLPLMTLIAGAGIYAHPEQGWRRAYFGLLAVGLSLFWWMQGRDWGMGAANQGYAAAKIWAQKDLQAGDTVYLAGQAKSQGWKARFYFHPGHGQGLQQREIQRLSEAKERGWVLAYPGDLQGRAPDLDTGQGLVLWRIRGTHGL